MACKLDIVEYGYRFKLAWFEDGEEGGFLGQDPDDGTGKPPVLRESWEHWAASKAVRPASRDDLGFFWESIGEARSALAKARAALKFERPLPEWAQTAIANGWKAPKGWKP
jgi:hypothetical protein